MAAILYESVSLSCSQLTPCESLVCLFPQCIPRLFNRSMRLSGEMVKGFQEICCNIKLFKHVSTCYCHCVERFIRVGSVYPPQMVLNLIPISPMDLSLAYSYLTTSSTATRQNNDFSTLKWFNISVYACYSLLSSRCLLVNCWNIHVRSVC